MIELYEQEIAAYSIFGIVLNFLFSMLFGLYMSRNIGLEEMMQSRGDREQPWWVLPALVVPFAKVAVVLYRIAVLQFYFLNRGRTHKEYWVYLTHDDE